MSRFVNPDTRDRLVLGPCECPGKPHPEDWIELRTELSADDRYTIAKGDSVEALATLAVAWNLLDDDGEAAPLDREHLGHLFWADSEALDTWINEHARLSALPNRSAARSPTTSRASGSRRTRRAKRAA